MTRQRALNSRERVQRAVHFGHPDRAPISHAVLPAAQLKYGEALAEILTEYREDFGWDYMADLPVEGFSPLYKQGRNVDDFGTVWYGECLGVCGIPVEWPLADVSRYDQHRWPDDFTAGPPSFRQYSGHMMGYDERWPQGPRCLDHLLRAAPAVAGHGKPAGGHRAGVPRVLPAGRRSTGVQPALDREVGGSAAIRRAALRR